MITLGLALVVSAVGAIVWSNVVADDPADADDEVTLDEPGEYVEPGVATNPENAGATLPDVTLTDADGATFTLSPDDRPMVVNVWFSTCPPCARELVEFGEVERDLGDEVRFVGVNPSDSVDTMTEFAATREADYEHYRDADGAFVDELGIASFPVTLLVDADGVIVAQEGALTGRELRELLAERWGIE